MEALRDRQKLVSRLKALEEEQAATKKALEEQYPSFHQLVYQGDLVKIREYLALAAESSCPFDIDEPGVVRDVRTGYEIAGTPLYLAVYHEHVDIVSLLLEHGANSYSWPQGEDSLLAIVISKAKDPLPLVRCFLQDCRGLAVQPCAIRHHGAIPIYPLSYIVSFTRSLPWPVRKELYDLFLVAGAKVNKRHGSPPDPFKSFQDYEIYGWSLPHFICYQGEITDLKYFISHGLRFPPAIDIHHGQRVKKSPLVVLLDRSSRYEVTYEEDFLDLVLRHSNLSAEIQYSYSATIARLIQNRMVMIYEAFRPCSWLGPRHLAAIFSHDEQVMILWQQGLLHWDISRHNIPLWPFFQALTFL